MLCIAMTATHPSFVLHGPAEPRTPLVLDSPHSGVDFPADFGAAVSELALRDGEDCYVDELWQPATERGVGLLAASVPRTYIDYNRHPATSTSSWSKAGSGRTSTCRAARPGSARP